MKHNLILIFCLMVSMEALAQVFTNKEAGKKNEELLDSLNQAEYPYSLPIWGKKTTKAGYNLPYSAGVSVQYFWQESAIIIDNLYVGFNNGPTYNLDGLVRFDESKATASAISARPDIWLFPFLNVYGLFGVSQASTDVSFGVWVPDSTGVDKKVLSAGSVVDFTTTTFGFGMTPTIGIGGAFLALDMNIAWTDVPQLNKPTRTFIFGPRLGENFKFRKPERSIAVYAGGFRVALRSETEGSINLSEAFPEGGEAATKIDNGIEQVGDAQQQVDAWWNGLTQMEQNNPVNKAKYESANAALGKAGEILNAADGAVNTISTSTVQYSMDKTIKDAWNFILGTQFQWNKHLMVRGEIGFLGSRSQFTVGLQYRFGL